MPDSPIVSVTKSEDLFGKRISFLESGYIHPLLIHEKIAFNLISSEDYRRTELNMLFARRVERVKVYSIFRNCERGRRLMNAFDAVNSEGLKACVYEKLAREYLESL